MSKKYIISDWEIQELLKSAQRSTEEPEFANVLHTKAIAEQILTNLEELPTE